MTSRRWLGLILLVSAVVAVVFLTGPPPSQGPPLDPSSTGPLGTRALVLLLGELGADVDVGGQGPDQAGDVALVLADDLGDARRREVERWLQGGGTLVVADPRSPLNPFPVENGDGFALVEQPFDRACSIPALAPVTEVYPPPGSVGYGPIPGAQACFFRDGSAFVALVARGEGTVVAVGGAGLFTNQEIGDADNAVLAASLLAPRPGTEVSVLGPRGLGGGDQSLNDLVGDNVKASLAQLAVAFTLYVLWRSRRLGAPVLETSPVALRSSELVVAVGNLLHQAGHAGEAARLIGDDLRRRLAERLGLGGDAPAAQVASVAAARTGTSEDVLRSTMAVPAVDGPDALVAHSAAAEALYREVLRA